MKNGLCFTQNEFILDFLVQIRNQRQLENVPNFSQIGQKTKELEFRPENCLMTSYLPMVIMSAKVLWVWRDFLPE